MKLDIRKEAAKFYDLMASPFNGQDIPFYISLLPSSDCRILELGCGTGRVLIPLASHCAYIHGIDISEGMLALCREKLARHGIGSSSLPSGSHFDGCYQPPFLIK